VSRKPAVKARGVKATAVQARPRGLQLSAAQWKAYNKAYGAALKSGFAAFKAANAAAARSQSAAARQAAIAATAAVIRRSRLQAAYSLTKKAGAAHSAARTAAIAKFASQQSFRQATLAHQNKALLARVAADYQRHTRQAARLQFIYKGEKAYAHTAVMRTLTVSQAAALAQAQFAKAAAKSARKAAASVNNAPKNTARSAALSAANKAALAKVYANARAAGLSAAESVPRGPTRAQLRTAARVKAKKAAASRSRSRGALAAGPKGAAKKGARTARTAPRRTAPSLPGLPYGYGDPRGCDCVAAAVANHLMHATGCQLSQREYDDLARLLGPAPDLGEALDAVTRSPLPGRPLLSRYEPCGVRRAGSVIGFDTTEGAHAALYLGQGAIMSWGEVLPLREVILPGTAVGEAWSLKWGQ
jgi:hypothetical protein